MSHWFSSIPKVFLRHMCVLYQKKDEVEIPLQAFCDFASSVRGQIVWMLDDPLPENKVWEPNQVVMLNAKDELFSLGMGIHFQRLDDIIAQAHTLGFGSVHVVVNLAWLLDTDYPERRLFEWEHEINARVKQMDLHVLCLHENHRFSRAFLPYILFLHPFLWQGGTYHVNPHYLPSQWHTLFPLPKNLWLSPVQLPTPVPDANTLEDSSLLDCRYVRAYLWNFSNDLNNLLSIVALKLDMMENALDLPDSVRTEFSKIHEVHKSMVQKISQLQKHFVQEPIPSWEWQQEESVAGIAYPYWKAPVVPREMPAPTVATSSPSIPTIVLVDDEPSIVRLTQRILEKEGYHVRAFSGAREFLTQHEQNPFAFDLLVTDVVMPYMNGFELFLRLQERCPHVPTLFISGYTDNAFDEVQKLPPNSRFLAKPFLPQALLAVVHDCLGQKR